MTAKAAAAVWAVQRQHALWPYGELNTESLGLAGWRPTPIRDFVIKIFRECNLACDYCYVYAHVDQSWRNRPTVMTRQTWRRAVECIRRHVRRHDTAQIRVILHGGEPLLLGAAGIGELAADLRAAIEPACEVQIGLQTNGVLLDDAAIVHLRQHRIRVGVSVDGTQEHHDRHRPLPNGRGTFAKVSAAITRLGRPENRACYGGLLCTISPDADPIAAYEILRAFEPPMIDFLFPHANWARPPIRSAGSLTVYGDWLVTAFDRWYADTNPPGVRLFDDVIALWLGGRGTSEQIGLSPTALVVIETDGTIEQTDALKSAYPGAPATGLSVLRDEIDAVYLDPGVVARQLGRMALNEECLRCRIHEVCGAGHYAHRYRAGAGFRNPSVYCEDLRHFIWHVHDRVHWDLRAGATRRPA